MLAEYNVNIGVCVRHGSRWVHVTHTHTHTPILI
jgi:hypothetical protein